MGVIPTKKSLALCDKLTTSSFCRHEILSYRTFLPIQIQIISTLFRRRLAVVLVRLKFAETMKEAVTFVEQAREFFFVSFVYGSYGHVFILWFSTKSDIRVGTEIITDPAFLVTRDMEDYVTWVDTSKIKRKVLKYNDKLDDYDLLN